MCAGPADDIDSQWNNSSTYDGVYPPDWDARRKTVYRRDDWTCTNCGHKSGPHARRNGVPLHAHHEHPLSRGGSNQLSNLTTLCEACHNREHDHDITEGLDRPTRSERVWTWIRRVVAYLLCTVLCVVVHLGVVSVLSGYVSFVEIGDRRLLLSAGYGVVLVGLTYLHPHLVAIVFGLGGGLALALMYVLHSVSVISVTPAIIVAVAGLFWLPVALASGYVYRRS